MSEPSALRFSLRVLLIAVAIVALGAFALRSASPLWASIVMTLTVGMLLFAVLAAIFRQGAARAFWVGVAVCGWGYLACVFGPLQGVSGQLLTSDLLAYAAAETARTVDPTVAYPSLAPRPNLSRPTVSPRIPRVPSTIAVNPAVAPPYISGTNNGPRAAFVHHTSFMQIGQAMWALLFGFVGGVVACVLYSRRQAVEA